MQTPCADRFAEEPSLCRLRLSNRRVFNQFCDRFLKKKEKKKKEREKRKKNEKEYLHICSVFKLRINEREEFFSVFSAKSFSKL